MAYISIHPIKVSLGAAIDYICDPKKTEDQKNISSQLCHFKTAALMYQRTREKKNPQVKTLAFHVIQSFKEGEVTPEQAQEIGRETMKRFLGNDYEFVIATHNDTECIHNHIIINSVNFANGKSFSREHDQQRYPAWKRLRKISNDITSERGLSVIKRPDTASKSYYEWSMEKQGTSWKAQLKKAIDSTVRTADSFEDFIEKMRSQNIIVRYEPYKTKDGMILAFKMDGQKNFIYSQKLGKYYQEVNLRNRIERAVKRREMSPTERRQQRILEDDGKLKKLYDTSEFAEGGLREWAKKENRKIQMKTLNELHEKGFDSAKEFFEYHSKIHDKIEDLNRKYDDMKVYQKEIALLSKYLDIYHEYKDIYDYYKFVTPDPDKYFHRHEQEIMLFEEAKSELEKYGNGIPKRSELEHQNENINKLMTGIRTQIRELREELYSFNTLYHNLSEMYEKDLKEVTEKEEKERSSHKQQHQKNSDDIEL